MNYALRMLQIIIQSIISTVTLCAIGLGPVITYAYFGGTNEDVDMFLRGIGFLLVLFLIMYVCNPKRKENESDE